FMPCGRRIRHKVRRMAGPTFLVVEEGMERKQVAIVGGVPVGVALAVQLGIRGVSCALVESRTELGRIPKGQNLTQRTLEHFYFMGIVKELRDSRFLPP